MPPRRMPNCGDENGPETNNQQSPPDAATRVLEGMAQLLAQHAGNNNNNRGQQGFQGQQRQQPQNGNAPRPIAKPLCSECGRHHHGKCLFGTGKCYKCGGGHVVDNCPNARQPMAGRAFVMHAEEAEPDTTLITGGENENNGGFDS